MLLLGDIEGLVLVDGRGRAFAFQLEDHNTSVMASGE